MESNIIELSPKEVEELTQSSKFIDYDEFVDEYAQDELSLDGYYDITEDY